LLRKIRSFQGTLASRIRAAMFSTFAADKLPVINTNDSSNEVSAWKNSSVVAECFEKLKTNGDYINKILDKVYGTDPEKRPVVQVAFTVVLVYYVLNPKKEHIKIKEEILQRKIRKYLVCFCKYLKCMLYNIINNEFYLFRTK